MKVYLAGGINGLSDADAKDWREQAKRMLVGSGATTLDPMSRDYRGIEASNVGDIVRGDLHDIDECDAVLAMCTRPSWGTAMEIHYAHSAGKLVFAVVPDGPVSPWLQYHAHGVFTSLEFACSGLLGIAHNNGPLGRLPSSLCTAVVKYGRER